MTILFKLVGSFMLISGRPTAESLADGSVLASRDRARKTIHRTFGEFGNALKQHSDHILKGRINHFGAKSSLFSQLPTPIF